METWELSDARDASVAGAGPLIGLNFVRLRRRYGREYAASTAAHAVKGARLRVLGEYWLISLRLLAPFSGGPAVACTGCTH
jgi:hypothetical protein